MSSLVFLAIAVGVSVLGTCLLWLFSRERRTYDSSINDFRKNMGALAPPEHEKKSDRRGS
jgi:hypothetical protein